ncbi:MAG TPA: Stp1/IreP family PP2C-type Ser/Thr phosphatase [Thermoanaerobaculia bacterium]
MLVHAAQRSDVGKVRTENQDFSILTVPEEENAQKGRLMIVADGMGGHRGGATASRMAATIIKSEYLGAESPDIQESLRRALTTANGKIFTEAQTNPDLRGMGTTCSVLVVRDGEAYLAHVGDSRIYRVRGDEIKQLTEDHSLVASMVREGLLTSKEAEVHPRRNVLQRSLGVAEDVDVDVSAATAVLPGDVFILCSDGLHGQVKEDEILEMAKQSPEEAVEALVNRAIERGAPDNVTVIVARAEEVKTPDATTPDPEPPPAPATPDELDPSQSPTLRIRVEAPRRGTLLKWILITLLTGGAAGAAFLYWSLSRHS